MQMDMYATENPRSAITSAKLTLLRPVVGHRGELVMSNPLAQTMISHSRICPSAVSIPLCTNRFIGVVM
jgi:hypothetical protein